MTDLSTETYDGTASAVHSSVDEMSQRVRCKACKKTSFVYQWKVLNDFFEELESIEPSTIRAGKWRAEIETFFEEWWHVRCPECKVTPWERP
jgi:hypothetical protein